MIHHPLWSHHLSLCIYNIYLCMSSLFYYYFFPYIMSCRRNMQGVTSYDNKELQVRHRYVKTVKETVIAKMTVKTRSIAFPFSSVIIIIILLFFLVGIVTIHRFFEVQFVFGGPSRVNRDGIIIITIFFFLIISI